MRKNHILVTYQFMFILTLFSSVAAYSQCNVSHISNNTSNAANNNIPIVYAQSFEATCSGNMQYFELISFEIGTISFGTLNIYNGNTVSGTPIYTQSYPQRIITTAGDPITFNITGTAPLVLNNQYTFEFTVDNVDFLYEETPATYAGGYAWQAGDSLTDYDLIFSFSINSNVGINEQNQTNTIMLYPNPSTGLINISGLINVEKYTIYNVLAEKIITGTISNNEKMDIQHLTNGLYFLKFENGNTLKFIKE